MLNADGISEVAAAKAVSHPLRATILGRLALQTCSPIQLASELSEALGNVSYHVAMLRDLGMVDLVGTAPRRGATEHFYRARWRVCVQVERVGE